MGEDQSESCFFFFFWFVCFKGKDKVVLHSQMVEFVRNNFIYLVF